MAGCPLATIYEDDDQPRPCLDAELSVDVLKNWLELNSVRSMPLKGGPRAAAVGMTSVAKRRPDSANRQARSPEGATPTAAHPRQDAKSLNEYIGDFAKLYSCKMQSLGQRPSLKVRVASLPSLHTVTLGFRARGRVTAL